MGLKDDYFRSSQNIQQQLQRQKQIELEKKRQQIINEQEETRCRNLCKNVPSLYALYKLDQMSDMGRRKNYRGVYKNTLAVSLTEELQGLINEFIEICPASAWISLPREHAFQKCILADRSVHIFPVLAPGDDPFRFGSQNYVILPSNYVEYNDTHITQELYIFQDGFVQAPNIFWTEYGYPLSDVNALNKFLLNQCIYYDRYKQFNHCYHYR